MSTVFLESDRDKFPFSAKVAERLKNERFVIQTQKKLKISSNILQELSMSKNGSKMSIIFRDLACYAPFYWSEIRTFHGFHSGHIEFTESHRDRVIQIPRSRIISLRCSKILDIIARFHQDHFNLFLVSNLDHSSSQFFKIYIFEYFGSIESSK